MGGAEEGAVVEVGEEVGGDEEGARIEREEEEAVAVA